MKNLPLLLCFLALCNHAYSQSGKEQALEIAQKAIKVMDEGRIDESIELLSEAIKLDPDRIDYPYEIAYAYYLKKDYQKSIEVASELLSHKNVNDRVYQLLGSVYDYSGKPDKALEIYAAGIEKFPNSGRLYLESGIVEKSRDNYNEAIQFWEQGIKAEPNFSSNYYWLAKVFSMTDERVWMLLYGELFINLEYGSKRTEEISRLLYENYLHSYNVLSDSSGEFQLTKKGFQIVLEDKKDIRKAKKGVLPFEGTYATVYSLSALDFHAGINLQAIYKARVNFVDHWFGKYHKQYSNKLFERQKTMIDAGVFEAYCYWFISQGDFDAFNRWHSDNEDKFNQFADWIKSNPIDLTASDFYSRLDY